MLSYYPKIGESFTLRCNDTSSFVCYSSYTFQTRYHSMIILNDTNKYDITKGSLTIKKVEASDSGYYTCVQQSTACSQMRSDSIDYYIGPTDNGKQVDNPNWKPIPPIIEEDSGLFKRLYDFVIFYVFANVIVLGAIMLLLVYKRRKQQPKKKNQKNFVQLKELSTKENNNDLETNKLPDTEFESESEDDENKDEDNDDEIKEFQEISKEETKQSEVQPKSKLFRDDIKLLQPERDIVKPILKKSEDSLFKPLNKLEIIEEPITKQQAQTPAEPTFKARLAMKRINTTKILENSLTNNKPQVPLKPPPQPPPSTFERIVFGAGDMNGTKKDSRFLSK